MYKDKIIKKGHTIKCKCGVEAYTFDDATSFTCIPCGRKPIVSQIVKNPNWEPAIGIATINILDYCKDCQKSDPYRCDYHIVHYPELSETKEE